MKISESLMHNQPSIIKHNQPNLKLKTEIVKYYKMKGTTSIGKRRENFLFVVK